MKQQALTLLVVAVLVAVLTHEFWARHVETIKPVPQITTVYDTVKTVVTLQGPKIVTTDTIRIKETVTLHDTVQIYVGADTSQRPPLWPVLNATIGQSRGDTSLTTTFNLRSGKTEVTKWWTPGPLKGIYADSSGSPRMDFWPPPEPATVSLGTKIKWTLIGGGLCFAAKGVGDALH